MMSGMFTIGSLLGTELKNEAPSPKFLVLVLGFPAFEGGEMHFED